MIKVYESDDRVLIHHLKNMLETEGIECLVKNDHIHTLAGEVPMVDTWPELWVADDDLADRARQIVERSANQPAPGGPDWVCAQCGETHEPQFSQCWNCGADKPD